LPPSSERQTPESAMPAKTEVPLTVSEVMIPLVTFLGALQVSPLFVEPYMESLPPAKTLVPVVKEYIRANRVCCQALDRYTPLRPPANTVVAFLVSEVMVSVSEEGDHAAPFGGRL
jgi:hypothetical protein